MRRLLPLVVLCALLLAPSASAARTPPRSWAQGEIRTVVERGLMRPSAGSFRPNEPLTQGELSELVAALMESVPVPAVNPLAPVTIAQLDARLVRALGLRDAAYRFFVAARLAGLTPPSRFGTEVVARLLGLRPNHPRGQDQLEPLPADPATRAEAAYSGARILRLGGWEMETVREAALAFELPGVSSWQKRVLTTAVGLIGFPYVWGGTADGTTAVVGTPRGGFDCSGFVWRVYKLQAYADGGALAVTLHGRTTYAMSGEVPRGQRVAFAKLEPGDLVFFGRRGPRSRPAAIDHMGIFLGNGWMIHSSENGVAVSPLEGWYRKRFAWGRRPLAEAGLI
jgi:cell wall-associated NlpC family hydrolase